MSQTDDDRPPIIDTAITAADINEDGVTYYTVEVKNSESDDSVIILSKRYSEFRDLFTNLKKKYPDLKDRFPKFPPKLFNTTPRDIEIRWEKLAQFLKFIVSEKVLSNDSHVKDFVYGKKT